MAQQPSPALEAFHALIQQQGWSLVTERTILSGTQFVVTDQKSTIHVSFYRTGTILIQGAPGTLREALEAWKQDLHAGRASPFPAGSSQPMPATSAPSESMRFRLDSRHWEPLHARLLELEEGQVISQPCTDAAQRWRLEIRQAQVRVIATLYTTGTLLIQGKASPLFEAVCATIETFLGSSFAERGARYIPEAQRERILHHLAQPIRHRQASAYAEQQLGPQLYAFLSPADHDTYLAAAGALLSLQATQTALPDYSLLVMPFARVYEGFLLQLASTLDPAARQQPAHALKKGKAHLALATLSKLLHQGEKQQAERLKNLLYETWRGIRNKVMHAQGQEPAAYRQLQAALDDIGSLHQAMREGYAYAVRCGLLSSTSQEQGMPAQKQEPHDRRGTEKRPSRPRSEEPGKDQAVPAKEQGRQTNDASPHALKEPTPPGSRIGIDESGKGDYFGPLVIAAVYVDAQTENDLRALGVRDSKRLTDNQMRPMAEAIKRCCQQSVVVIAPRRYNELYASIGHLNRLLAWGHARALENLLEQVDCPLAIADQFGDASFLQKALLQKGRHITLQQRPRAEDDLAVAAASILARVAFVQRLEWLGRQIGHTLPKGASAPAIFTVGRAIVAQGGEPALRSVAKLHFKTTQAILTPTEEA
jgi:ribonuclease HIII